MIQHVFDVLSLKQAPSRLVHYVIYVGQHSTDSKLQMYIAHRIRRRPDLVDDATDVATAVNKRHVKAATMDRPTKNGVRTGEQCPCARETGGETRSRPPQCRSPTAPVYSQRSCLGDAARRTSRWLVVGRNISGAGEVYRRLAVRMALPSTRLGTSCPASVDSCNTSFA